MHPSLRITWLRVEDRSVTSRKAPVCRRVHCESRRVRIDLDRVQARHEAKLKPSATERTVRHDHRPTQTSELTAASGASLSIVLNEGKSVEHYVPLPFREMTSREHHCVGRPRCAGPHPLHGNS